MDKVFSNIDQFEKEKKTLKIIKGPEFLLQDNHYNPRKSFFTNGKLTTRQYKTIFHQNQTKIKNKKFHRNNSSKNRSLNIHSSQLEMFPEKISTAQINVSSYSITTTPFPEWMTSIAVLSLAGVVMLTVFVGIIYVLIYFKSIKPKSSRNNRAYQSSYSMLNVNGAKVGEDENAQRSRSTHPIFKRS